MRQVAQLRTDRTPTVVRLEDRRPLKRRTPLTPEGELRRKNALACSTPLTRAPLAAAFEEQRRKVDGRSCLVCERSDGVDPAQLAPRSRGGCDHPDCVVPLCRRCHRAFDDGRLDLLPYLEPHHRAELGHALQHHGRVALLEPLTAGRWAPERRRRPDR